MPVVPTYEDRGIRLDPGLNFRDNTKATGEMFGSQVGDALGKAGQGLTDFGKAVAEVHEINATNDARDHSNAVIDRWREAGYGKNGYMKTTGRGTVTGLSGYEALLRDIAADGAKGLSPLAARKYWDATNPLLNNALADASRYATEQSKAWSLASSQSRIAVLHDDAVAKSDTPTAALLNGAVAVAQMQEIGFLKNWPEGEVKNQGLGIVSEMYKDIALKKVDEDAPSAMAFIKENAGLFREETLKELYATVGKAAADEETRRDALAFVSGTRAPIPSQAPVQAQGALKEGARTPTGNEQPAVQRPGPTRERAILLDHSAPGTDPATVLGMDNGLASNLSAFIEDAPPEIRAGLGVAFAGQSGDGRPAATDGADGNRAASLTYNGRRLDTAPPEVQEWALRTVGKYGLSLPSGIGLKTGDPNGGRLVAASDGVSARALMPSSGDAENYLLSIPDPHRRELARLTILNAWELRSREEAELQRAAKAELWRQIDSGATPDDIPFEVRQAAGMEAMTSARTYYTKKLADQAIVTDPEVLRNLRLSAASMPHYFASLDLKDYRHLLSDSDYRDLTEKQAGIIENDRAVDEKGADLMTAFDMAKVQLEAAGVLKPEEEQTEEDRQRLARFQNDLYGDIAALTKEKPGHSPNPFDFQRSINKLLLPILIKTPGRFWDGETRARLFDAKHLKDGQTYELNILPEDIPVDLRGQIRKELEMELGKQPTDEQVGAEYGAIVEGKPLPFAGTRRERELATGIRRAAALKGR